MIRRLRALGALTALIIAVPGAASAQGVDGAWLDRMGRYSELQLGNEQPDALQAGSRQLADYLNLFKQACLDLPFSSDAPKEVVEASNWGFKRLDHSVPAGANPADLGGWQAADVSVRATKGLFFAPNPQCNVTAALASPLDGETLETAVTQMLGSSPANTDKKLDKKGQRRRGFEPMWKLVGPNGIERTVYARAMTGSAGTRLHLAVMEPKGSNK